MVIIKLKGFSENSESFNKQFKASFEAYAERSVLFIRGKPHYVVEVTERGMKNAEFLRLLNAYKGNILLSKELENNEFLNEYAFDISPFLRRVCFSEFVGAVKSQKCRNLSLCLKNTEKVFSLEAEKLLPYIKELIVICADEHFASEFPDHCFFEYGVRPFVTTDISYIPENVDIFADFDSISENKFLKYQFCGNNETMYPDFSSETVDNEIMKICNLGVKKEYVLASFMY